MVMDSQVDKYVKTEIVQFKYIPLTECQLMPLKTWGEGESKEESKL